MQELSYFSHRTCSVSLFYKSDKKKNLCYSGLTCQHVNKAVDLSSVKRAVLSSVWLVCSECLKERTMIDGEPAASHDILVCLKCGFQVRLGFLLANWSNVTQCMVRALGLCFIICGTMSNVHTVSKSNAFIIL